MPDEPDEPHPSYGLLAIHRVSGGSTSLFGSSIDHGHTIRLTISRAVRRRDLSRYWYCDTKQLIEIEMSPVQWAEAISSLNCGVGEPCTLLRVAGQTMPKYEGVPPVREQAEIDFAKSMKRVADEFQSAAHEAKELLKKKSMTNADRESIIWAFERLEQEIRSNLPFVHSQFNEAVDKTVCEAKGEIDAFLTHAVMNAGRLAIAAKIENGELAQPGIEVKCLDAMAT